jgi:diguanylate cyclase (GGDEF)-like protein
MNGRVDRLADPVVRDLFEEEVATTLDAVEALLPRLGEPEAVDELYGHAHALRGTAAVLDLAPMSSAASLLADVFDALRRRQAAPGADVADALRAAVSELRYLASGLLGGIDVECVAVDAQQSLRALRDSVVEAGRDGGANARVLIADDSAAVRKVLRRELTSNGWDVREAPGGAEALELCRADPPEILLLDIEMPRVNGFQVLSAMRRDSSLAEIPVIFLTAHSSPSEVAEGLRRGAHDYLRKPCQTPELVARLLVARRTKHLRDELRARNQELERLATTDVLTELKNRRSIQLELQAAVSRAARHETALSVLLIDIDHFKQVNDGHGHMVGDEVLQEVVRRLRSRLRLEDSCGRWGGEEFLVLLPDTTGEAAAILAENLRSLVGDAPIGAAELRVTISIGAAQWRGEAPDELIRRADAALYDAKAAGRNAVRA